MFGNSKISKSLLDAVNSVIGNDSTQVQQLDEATSEKVPTSTGMKVYGHRYGDSKKARKDQTKSSVDDLKGPKEKEMKEDLKGNQYKIDKNHNNKIDAQDFKILRGKKEVKESDDCVTKPEVKKIADKEVDKHEKHMHKGKKLTFKEGSFAERLVAMYENDLSEKIDTKTKTVDMLSGRVKVPANYDDATEHKASKVKLSAEEKEEGHEDEKADKALVKKMVKKDALKEEEVTEEVKKSDVPAFLRKMRGDKPLTVKDVKSGSKDSISHKDNLAKAKNEEVEHLDETPGAQAMKASGVKQSPDKLLARTGMNMAHKFPRKGQTNLGNIPAMNTPGNSPETDAYAEKRRGDRANQLKPAIKSALGTHGPKGKLPEEFELTEEQLDEMINEVLGKDASAGDYIHDFIHSDNPKFAGKSKAERKKMALGAYYGKQNEEVEAVEEKVIAGTPGWKEVPKEVKDKSGAVHSPMSRAKDLAKKAFKKVKNETMMGKISN